MDQVAEGINGRGALREQLLHELLRTFDVGTLGASEDEVAVSRGGGRSPHDRVARVAVLEAEFSLRAGFPRGASITAAAKLLILRLPASSRAAARATLQPIGAARMTA